MNLGTMPSGTYSKTFYEIINTEQKKINKENK